MKQFFRIEENYRFEWNDLRALITIINVMLVILYGYSVAWFGLSVGLIGMIKDFTADRRINGVVMHLSNVILNIYFLSLTF